MRHSPIPSSTKQAGASLIEVVVTLMLLSLYAVLILQLFVANERQRVALEQRNAATMIAYSNLRKITSKAQIPTGAPYDCTLATGAGANNLVARSDAEGVELLGTSLVSPEATPTLLQSAQQRLYLTYPQGCDAQLPIRLVSKVTYGSPSREVVHATYVY